VGVGVRQHQGQRPYQAGSLLGRPGPPAQVLGAGIGTGKVVTIHRFDNSKSARSWRVSHPHPAFSPDGKRLYFNVSAGQWTRFHVAEVMP
jgi:hypothetical protein